jgi:NADH dehydrogenase [ubiquinone] 1 alpha subcomplex assembly factor 7
MSFADELIADIQASGDIAVADYMARSNAHYYSTRDPFGSAGDFITAPEISQMFGELVGAWAADLWQRAGRPAAVALVELGPGRGTLMADMLRAAAPVQDFRPDVHFIETSPTLRQAQQARVPAAILHDDTSKLPDDRPLIVVGNEFFDALPVVQEVRTTAGWRPRLVTATSAGLAFRPEGEAIRELSPARDAAMADLAGRIARQGGAALIIDYGYAVAAAGDSLQALRAGKSVHPLAHPGDADLTAHVDFGALARTAAAAGCAVLPIAAQGRFLLTLGIEARAAALSARLDAWGRHAIAAAMRRLTMPQAMGELFKVLAITHKDWPRPAGFPL